MSRIQHEAAPAEAWAWDFEADPDLPHFVDHLPGIPILPGVALLDLAVVPGIRRHDSTIGRLIGARRVKFRRPVPAGALVHIEATRRAGIPGVAFEAFLGPDICASGTLEFEGS